MSRQLVSVLAAMCCAVFLRQCAAAADPLRFGPAPVSVLAYDMLWTPKVEINAAFEVYASTAKGRFIVRASLPKAEIVSAIGKFVRNGAIAFSIGICEATITDATAIDLQITNQTLVIDARLALDAACRPAVPAEMTIHLALSPDVRQRGHVGLALGQLRLDLPGIESLLDKPVAWVAARAIRARLARLDLAIPSGPYGRFAIQGVSLSSAGEDSVAARIAFDSLHTQAQLTALMIEIIRKAAETRP